MKSIKETQLENHSKKYLISIIQKYSGHEMQKTNFHRLNKTKKT